MDLVATLTPVSGADSACGIEAIQALLAKVLQASDQCYPFCTGEWWCSVVLVEQLGMRAPHNLHARCEASLNPGDGIFEDKALSRLDRQRRLVEISVDSLQNEMIDIWCRLRGTRRQPWIIAQDDLVTLEARYEVGQMFRFQ